MIEIQEIGDVLLRDINGFSGSLANRVYESLKESIICFELQPGLTLRKKVICEQFSVSRAPVAEAIARLAAEGLVEVIPQSGTKVSRLSMDEIREGAFLREALELAAVEKVANERTDKQLAQLTRNIKLQSLLVDDDDLLGFHQVDDELHGLLMAFTGFGRVSEVAATIWLQVNRARQLLLPSPGRARESLEEHTLIVEAIKNKDTQAARLAMKKHLGHLIHRLEPLEAEQPNLFKKNV